MARVALPLVLEDSIAPADQLAPPARSSVRRARRLAALRVLLVVDSLDGGGAERYVVDLAAALRERGHSPLIACAAGGVHAETAARAGVPVLPLLDAVVKRRLSPRFARALRRVVVERRPDLVHAHIYASASAAALATAGLRVPLVVTEHTEAPWRGRGARLASRLTYRRADRLVAVSSAIERLLREGYRVPPERVTAIPTAIAPRPGATTPWPPLPAGRPLVGRVSRLAPEKGVDVFLHAAARLAPLHPEARFLVVGDGPCRAELEALAATLGLGERVHFLGFRPDARAVIADLDVLAVTSRSDGAPLVVLEAMAAAVPVVASAVGGLVDQVAHGRTGLLVPPDEPGALAEALGALLGDRARAHRLGRAGQAHAAAFGHAAMVSRMEGIYRDALARA